MDRGKDIGPIEREPRVLTEHEVKEAHQEALTLGVKRFTGTPLGIVFLQDDFAGERVFNSGMGRNYRATRTEDRYGDEIIVQATIKGSDHSKGDFLGDEIRIRRPSPLGHTLLFEHVIHEKGGIRRTAEANTDINRDSGIEVLRHLPKLR